MKIGRYFFEIIFIHLGIHLSPVNDELNYVRIRLNNIIIYIISILVCVCIGIIICFHISGNQIKRISIGQIYLEDNAIGIHFPHFIF